MNQKGFAPLFLVSAIVLIGAIIGAYKLGSIRQKENPNAPTPLIK